jgi:hypothetical protein
MMVVYAQYDLLPREEGCSKIILILTEYGLNEPFLKFLMAEAKYFL